MPVFNPNGSNQNNPGQRTTFRPPWVKEGPTPLPMPSAPWTKSKATEVDPSTPDLNQSIVAKAEPVGVNTEKTIPIQIETKEKSIPIRIETKSRNSEKRQTNEKKKNDRTIPVVKEVAIAVIHQQQPPKAIADHSSRMEAAHPSPPPPPPPPPPIGLPPTPPALPQPIERKPLTAEKSAKLEALRARPRRRPDWTDILKEVEQGAKLKHVQCNDRSAPILPQSKAKGQFVYESEKDNAHNQLLKQIQTGVRLKKVRTNDRSKPILDGLRKFRRQMTIEEQIQKSTSVADVVALAAEPDELDDIDKVRDDLQCAKQMLALEIRNKEGLERENKRLIARLQNLEAELEKEKASKKAETEKGAAVVQVRIEADEKLIQRVKEEASAAAAAAKEMEDKYQKIAEELDSTRAKLESAWLRNQQLELQLKTYEKESAAGIMPIMKQPSSKKLAASMASMNLSDDESDYEEETETESEQDEENEKDAEAAQERRTQRELKLFNSKVRSFKSKQDHALKERKKLRELVKKQQKALREEKKKYKLLQKEVDKMAKLMKDVDEDDEEDEDEKIEDEETDSESEESESEEDEEEESDGECPENVAVEEKKRFLNAKAKKYENRLLSLKKGNYLMKANIDRLQDDINRQKEESLTLQEDLNSVLAELG